MSQTSTKKTHTQFLALFSLCRLEHRAAVQPELEKRDLQASVGHGKGDRLHVVRGRERAENLDEYRWLFERIGDLGLSTVHGKAKHPTPLNDLRIEMVV